MADTIDKVSERLTNLEVTVAQGFHDSEQRDLDLSRKIVDLNRKIDVATKALRSDIRNVTDAVTSLGEEMRRR